LDTSGLERPPLDLQETAEKRHLSLLRRRIEKAHRLDNLKVNWPEMKMEEIKAGQ